jgi:hypothetical protein
LVNLPHFGKLYQEKSGNPAHISKTLTAPGLPDGLFLNQTSQFGYILDGLRLELVDIFHDHLENFMDIWDIL